MVGVPQGWRRDWGGLGDGLMVLSLLPLLSLVLWMLISESRTMGWSVGLYVLVIAMMAVMGYIVMHASLVLEGFLRSEPTYYKDFRARRTNRRSMLDPNEALKEMEQLLGRLGQVRGDFSGSAFRWIYPLDGDHGCQVEVIYPLEGDRYRVVLNRPAVAGLSQDDFARLESVFE